MRQISGSFATLSLGAHAALANTTTTCLLIVMAFAAQLPAPLHSRVVKYGLEVLARRVPELEYIAREEEQEGKEFRVLPVAQTADGYNGLVVLAVEEGDGGQTASGEAGQDDSTATRGSSLSLSSSSSARAAAVASKLYDEAVGDACLQRYMNRAYLLTDRVAVSAAAVQSHRERALEYVGNNGFLPANAAQQKHLQQRNVKKQRTSEDGGSVTTAAASESERGGNHGAGRTGKGPPEVAGALPMWLEESRASILALLERQLPPGSAAAGERLRLQAFPRVCEQYIARAVMEERQDLQLHPVNFQNVLHVVFSDEAACVFFGICGRDRYFVREEGSGGIQEKEDSISRAHWKVREALERVDAHPTADWSVLDVGAAPGGWTKYFAPICKRVVANDPAEMDKFLMESHPNIIHVKARLQNELEQVASLGPYDAVVCDINVSPELVVETLAAAVPMLKPGGLFVFTFKLPRRKEGSKAQDERVENHRRTYMEKCPELEDVRIYWLLANKNERTLVARKAKLA